jgi:hypothetical protein
MYVLGNIPPKDMPSASDADVRALDLLRALACGDSSVAELLRLKRCFSLPLLMKHQKLRAHGGVGVGRES